MAQYVFYTSTCVHEYLSFSSKI